MESNFRAPLGAPMSAEYRSGHRGWQPVGGLGVAASVLIGLVALLAGLRTIALLSGQNLLVLLYALGYVVALIAAAAVFVVWVRRARANIHLVAGRRFSRKPGFGGRFFWAPQYVIDVWRASAPDGAGGERLVMAWWLTWLASKLVAVVDPGVADRLAVAAVAAALEIAAAVLAVLIIRKISEWQSVPRV